MPEQPHHRFTITARLDAILLDVSLELRAPWTVLYGPSGSGKSTILRALCGVLPHSTAHVSFDRWHEGGWHPLADLRPNHRQLAWSPQHAAVFPHMTAGENVRFPSRASAEGPANSALIEQAITLFRMHTLAPRRIQQLSGGERQRVSLARAFATPGAQLLLLDEPFSGLDRTQRDAFLRDLQPALAARHLPCLSVTHDVDEALLLDADVIRLENGRVVAQGPAHEVLADERRRLLSVLRD